MVELVKQNFKENKKYYERIEKNLRKEVSNEVPIEHVGSTAIPNVEFGKNIIDILVGAKDNEQFEQLKNILSDMGYAPSMKSKDDIYQFFSSTLEETKSGDVHIHLVIINTDRYSNFLALREYLLTHDDEAKKYSDFKVEILDLGNKDRREYKRVKSEYVTNLLNRARNWYKSQNE